MIDDLGELVALIDATDPHADVTADDLAHRISSTPARLDVTERDASGVLVAWGYVEPIAGSSDWAATVQVRASTRLRGVGGRVLASLTRHAAAAGATALEVESRDDTGTAFLLARGFVETGRELEVALDLVGTECGLPVPPQRVTIVRRSDHPGLESGMYAVALEAEPDIPGAHERGPGTFEEFLAVNLDRPARRPELTFVALVDGKVVGYAILHAGPRDVCFHGMTGVARAWRGRGVAAALKRNQIVAARAAGYRLLVTENEERNVPIRRLNEAFGYTPYGQTLFLRKEL